MKLKSAEKQLLFEAYRRNEMADSHERSKPLSQRWLGLGTEAAYREALDAGLMTWANSVPAHRCMGWLVLTKKGIQAMQKCASEFEQAMQRMIEGGYKRSILSHYMLAGGLQTRSC